MIIEPKSTRQSTKEGDSRKRFEFDTPERLSKVPLYVALLVIAVAAYIKSAFAEVLAGTRLDHDRPGPADEPVAPPDELDQTITGSIGETGEPQNRIGRGLPWDTEFLPPDSPALVFANTFEPYRMALAPYLPTAFSLLPSNDNGGGFPAGGSPIGGGPGPAGGNPGPGPGPGTPPNAGPGDDGEDGNTGNWNGSDDGGTAAGGDGDSGPSDDGDEEDEEDDDPATNRLPTVAGPVRLNDVFAGQVVLIGLSELLFGAYDADADLLSVLNLTVAGASISPAGEGWLLASEHGMLGPVTFSYEISDGHGSIMQTAYLEIVRNVEVLTPGNDVHVGTPYDDDIDALGGDDIIESGAGHDLVAGGPGNDHIMGGDGSDHLFGGTGCDVIFGGAGDDMIRGGADDDRLFGDAGRDTLHGDEGNDALFGGADDDIADGGSGNDALHGETGNDVLVGGDGCDLLDGGSGDDVLMGGAHDDELIGGAGDDVLDGGSGDDRVAAGEGDDTIVGGAGNDTLDGGDGFDVLDLTAATASLLVDHVEGRVRGRDVDTDTFANVEEVNGGDGDDIFILGAKATISSGGRGRDTFVFQVTDEDPTLSEDVVHDILDFVVGDRVRVRDYDIDRAAREAVEDLFKAVYDEDGDDDWLKSDLPILTRHERYDDVDHTIIQADIDRDDVYEITINIHGIHLPLTTSTDLA